MIRELDTVVLKKDLPEHGLETGDVGTVVLVHKGRTSFEVEFATLTGHTVAVVTLSADAVRAIDKHEIAHARRVAHG
jgi:Domain of unknown function (DUF4926)